jgi:L-lactate dehydrogenase complex protein LldE
MRVGLFVPCLVDRFLPEVGLAACRLLEAVGVSVEIPARVTCCGQPQLNAGHPDLALRLARRLLRHFPADGFIVVPSGSCVATIRESYGLLDLSDADMQRWQRLRERVFELSEFLLMRGLDRQVTATLKARVAVHWSCHHLRALEGRSGLMALLDRITGIELVQSHQEEQCCGFGGFFSVRLPELSIAMARERLDALLPSRPDLIALADAGCILQLRGVLRGSYGLNVPPIVHYAQLFSGVGLPEVGHG